MVTRFPNQALGNEDITVHGDGIQSRCFTDVRDVVGALVRLADCDDAIGEVVNIGSRHEFSIQQVADLVKSTTRTALPGNLLAGPILCARSRSAAGGNPLP